MGMGMDEDCESPGVQVNDRVWVMRNGEEILIEHMSDRHLRNTIKMLERKGGQMHPQWSVLVQEANKRRWR